MEGCEVPFEVTAVMQRSVGTGGDGISTPTKHGVPSKQEQRQIDTDERKQERSTEEGKSMGARNFRGWKQVVKDGTPTWTAEWSGDWESAQLWWSWSDDDEQELSYLRMTVFFGAGVLAKEIGSANRDGIIGAGCAKTQPGFEIR